MSNKENQILSDKKIIEKLTFICETFYKIKSNASKSIIDKTIKLINFVEHCSKNYISITSEVVTDIIKYINKIEEYIFNMNKQREGVVLWKAMIILI